MADYIIRRKRDAIRRMIVPMELSAGINLLDYDFSILMNSGETMAPIAGATVGLASQDDIDAIPDEQLPKPKSAYSFIKIFVPGGNVPVASGSVLLSFQSVSKINPADVVTHFDIPVKEA